jgi:hypothetical protein
MISKNVFEKLKGKEVVLLAAFGRHKAWGKIMKVTKQQIHFRCTTGEDIIINIGSIACVLFLTKFTCCCCEII